MKSFLALAVLLISTNSFSQIKSMKFDACLPDSREGEVLKMTVKIDTIKRTLVFSNVRIYEIEFDEKLNIDRAIKGKLLSIKQPILHLGEIRYAEKGDVEANDGINENNILLFPKVDPAEIAINKKAGYSLIPYQILFQDNNIKFGAGNDQHFNTEDCKNLGI